jgi:hypothetical protein
MCIYTSVDIQRGAWKIKKNQDTKNYIIQIKYFHFIIKTDISILLKKNNLRHQKLIISTNEYKKFQISEEILLPSF